jgi:hypothetical protein
MKTLLGCLMCSVLTMSQAFAITGGPFGGGKANVVGTYGGALTPKPNTTDNPPNCSANSIGIFSVGVPKNGIATGTFVMFSQGRVFSGTVQGTADQGKGTLKGVLTASFNFNVTFPPTPCPTVTPAPSCTPSAFTIAVTAMANGKLDTQIVSPQNLLGATRLRGTATLDISHGEVDSNTLEPIVSCEMTLKVTGFKQSSTSPASSVSG